MQRSDTSLTEREALRTLVEHIKGQRLARNWTQREFASRVGISRATVANLETGYANLSLLNLVRILSTLGQLERLPQLVPAVDERSTWDSTIAAPVRRRRASGQRAARNTPGED